MKKYEFDKVRLIEDLNTQNSYILLVIPLLSTLTFTAHATFLSGHNDLLKCKIAKDPWPCFIYQILAKFVKCSTSVFDLWGFFRRTQKFCSVSTNSECFDECKELHQFSHSSWIFATLPHVSFHLVPLH